MSEQKGIGLVDMASGDKSAETGQEAGEFASALRTARTRQQIQGTGVPQNDPPGTVASRIGGRGLEGFEAGFGSNWFIHSAKTNEALRKSGLYNDYSREWTSTDYALSVPRWAHEALNNTSRTVLEVGLATPLRTINGAYHAGANMVGQSVAETGFVTENQGQQIAREIKAMPEAFAGVGHILGTANRTITSARNWGITETKQASNLASDLTGPTYINGRQILNAVLTEYETFKPQIQGLRREVTVIQIEAAPNAPKITRMRTEASAVSARQKDKTFSHLGYNVNKVVLPHDISPAEFANIIDKANNNPNISGVIVQMPVRDSLGQVIKKIAPEKDIDALTRHTLQQSCATADGICRLAAPYISPDSQIVVVGGRGFVGSGVIRNLQTRGFNPHVVDLGDPHTLLKEADIVITTVGKGHHLTPDKLGPNKKKVIIDSGFTPKNDKPIGDVHPEAERMAEYITPVPGGIGPTEMAVLAERILKIDLGPENIPTWRYDGKKVIFDKE